jgi:hypothetical protein
MRFMVAQRKSAAEYYAHVFEVLEKPLWPCDPRQCEGGLPNHGLGGLGEALYSSSPAHWPAQLGERDGHGPQFGWGGQGPEELVERSKALIGYGVLGTMKLIE